LEVDPPPPPNTHCTPTAAQGTGLMSGISPARAAAVVKAVGSKIPFGNK